jgi:hypothetical protein
MGLNCKKVFNNHPSRGHFMRNGTSGEQLEVYTNTSNYEMLRKVSKIPMLSSSLDSPSHPAPRNVVGLEGNSSELVRFNRHKNNGLVTYFCSHTKLFHLKSKSR